MGQCLHTPTSIDVAVCTFGVFGEYIHVHMLYRCIRMIKTINYIMCIILMCIIFIHTYVCIKYNVLLCIIFMISVFEGL